MSGVNEMDGEHPLPTPEDVVPDTLLRHTSPDFVEIVRPVRIFTEEFPCKQRVKCVKRSSLVSSCTTYICVTMEDKRMLCTLRLYVWGHAICWGFASCAKYNPPPISYPCLAMGRCYLTYAYLLIDGTKGPLSYMKQIIIHVWPKVSCVTHQSSAAVAGFETPMH